MGISHKNRETFSKPSQFAATLTLVTSLILKVNCTGGGDQNHPQEKEMQKGKWLRRPYK